MHGQKTRNFLGQLQDIYFMTVTQANKKIIIYNINN